MRNPEEVFAASTSAAHELAAETRRVLESADGDRTQTFAVAARAYAEELERHATAHGARGPQMAHAYSARMVAALLMQVVELEEITTGLAAALERADAEV